ncbi:MAG: S46 family peptidase, partial [Bacteroidetes bacterium]|nr:S46 family peptidase [Bacteroidota bacterium]
MLLVSLQSVADEGMWLSVLLEKNYQKMKKMGMELSLDELISDENGSLKDAIALLDGGSCTGEIISAQGLLLTNHHCGYRNIQEHSSVEHDYLTDGFWAGTLKEELPNPDKTAS